MSDSNLAVFGVFHSRDSLEDAIGTLRSSGFRISDVATLASENQGTKELSINTGNNFDSGAVVGVLIGGVLGAAIAWLVQSGQVPVPVLSALLTVESAAVAAWAGAGVGGVVGGCLGALIGSLKPRYYVSRHRGRLRRPGMLLSVHCDNPLWVQRAREVLRQAGAERLMVEREEKADYAQSPRPALRTPVRLSDPPLLEEEPLIRVREEPLTLSRETEPVIKPELTKR